MSLVPIYRGPYIYRKEKNYFAERISESDRTDIAGLTELSLQ